MIETRQLRYFITAADSKSFSEAAKILYASQSNVSKTINGLEKDLGYLLFQRATDGISLTRKGRIFYKKALEILEKVDDLEELSMEMNDNCLRIATNPSSWFARRFSEFYDLHAHEDYSYSIHTDSTTDIIQRIRNMEEDIGFIYVTPSYYSKFEHELKRYQLEFQVLGRTTPMLYFSTEDDISNDIPDMSIIKQYKLIQLEDNQFMKYGEWEIDKDNTIIQKLPVVITTNSDYIMNLMLKKPNIANISAKSFSKELHNSIDISLETLDRKIIYGVLYNKSNMLSDNAKELIEYIKKSIADC